MDEFAEMILTGIFCDGCGAFINGEPVGHPQKCNDCFDEELVKAVESDTWPDGMSHEEWHEVRWRFSEPEHAFRE